MEELLKEILKEIKYYNGNPDLVKGKGSKAYIVRRIDLLREKLFELRKGLNNAQRK